MTTPVQAMAAEGSKVRFEHEQSADDADNHAERRQSERDAFDIVTFGSQPGGDVDADRQLGELGWLKRRQRTELNPALGAVFLVSDAGYQHHGEHDQ